MGGRADSSTGCVDMKRVLADRIVARYAGARERYRELMDAPGRVDEIRRRARIGSSHVPRRRWPRSGRRWASADAMLNVQPGPRDRRLLSVLLILLLRGCLLHRQPAVEPVLLFRRHLPDVLPGLAPRVHHQPDRDPRDRPDPAPAAGDGDDPGLRRGGRAPHRAGRGRGRGAGPVDHAVPTQIPNIKDDLPTILAPWQERLDSIGLGQVDLIAQAEAALANPTRSLPRWSSPAADRGRQPRRRRDPADRVLPVDLHGPRPRRRAGLPVRIMLPSYSEEARLLEMSVSRSFGVPPRPGVDGLRLLPDRAGHEPCARPAVRGAHLRRRACSR